jgi:NAD(P)-dependent dehydrogenase (short-subunit alcohol dehydrogenase family)
MKLKDNVALITGGGGSFGRAMAELFAREGADIAVCDIDLASAEESAATVKQIGRKAIAIQANVANETEVDAMVDMVVNELGGIHILINNAGIPSIIVPTTEQTIEDWDRVISVNLRGTYLCSRKAGQWMTANKTGKIVNIAAASAISCRPMIASYGASKAGVSNITRVLAVEWGKYNININCLAPGLILTNLSKKAMKGSEQTAQAMLQRTPLGRLGTPEDIAHAALFLVSEDARHITGVTLPVDGGWLCS